jgi:YD repeat-containing protein
VDALGRTNLFIYDNADNLTASVNALGKTNYFSFDGNNNRVSATDFRGYTTTNIYDPKDRLIITRDPLGNSVTNDYDALDRKIRVWDAMGGVTRYGYDADRKSAGRHQRGGRRHALRLRPERQPHQRHRPARQLTTNAFDSLNRLVSTQDALGHSSRVGL